MLNSPMNQSRSIFENLSAISLGSIVKRRYKLTSRYGCSLRQRAYKNKEWHLMNDAVNASYMNSTIATASFRLRDDFGMRSY